MAVLHLIKFNEKRLILSKVINEKLKLIAVNTSSLDYKLSGPRTEL